LTVHTRLIQIAQETVKLVTDAPNRSRWSSLGFFPYATIAIALMASMWTPLRGQTGVRPRPDIEGPWEFASPSGIFGFFFTSFVHNSGIDIWGYERGGGKTSGGYFSSDLDYARPNDPSSSHFDGQRLRIHFVSPFVSERSFDVDIIFSSTERHWTGTWSRDGQSFQVVLGRPHPAAGVTPSTFVGDWEGEPDPNSRAPWEPGSLHIAESSDGVLSAWMDRGDYGEGERLYVSSGTQDALTLETTNPLGNGYRYQGSLSGDRQVLTGIWVSTLQPENRGTSLSAPVRFRRKP
jgi:hypothetical protein